LPLHEAVHHVKHAANNLYQLKLRFCWLERLTLKLM